VEKCLAKFSALRNQFKRANNYNPKQNNGIIKTANYAKGWSY
jgi:hypothetical protein